MGMCGTGRIGMEDCARRVGRQRRRGARERLDTVYAWGFNIQYSERVGGCGVMRQDIGVGWMDAVQRFPRVDSHAYKCRVYIFL